MIRNKLLHATTGLLLGLILAESVIAQSRWVSDEFEVTLRTGPSTSNAIQRMITSGTELEVLETDAESGYSKVRTVGGTEGWVLTRYLMSEPSAREQLETLTQQLTSVTSEGASMGAQMAAIRGEYDSAKRKISELEKANAKLSSELEEVTQKSANTLAIDRQNQTLQQQLTSSEIRVSSLEQENERLLSQSNRDWFIAGSLVLFGGIVVGLILPRLKFQRRSGYDRF
jgi:SH3 domain protein